jgi:hypothetical protein
MSSEPRRLERIVIEAGEPLEAAATWRETLALESAGRDCLRAGSVLIEMRPASEGEREGLSRLVIEVDDMAATLERLRSKGVDVSSGEGGAVCVDPAWTCGVAIKLVERSDKR